MSAFSETMRPWQSSDTNGSPGSTSTLRRRLPGLSVSAVVVVIVTILLANAAVYQPLGYASVSNADQAFPGLPTGNGIHAVNTFGFLHEDYYIPAQAGVFSLFADIRNNGSRA